ncbi:monofunctional biosynthetic peptidoglycan transglycosylase [Pseudothioclava arenosa]|uniref:Biosynthetic peptidoglycan transglycosylase n=2 Tax=Pseudothioclava arenosa TaxID=1795308 RepID=A0A2A4CN69_9RHOB|nr:monofunctional biosynthetic peptidoglycan transglycosylase [Pseudothioclava arenosa]
MASSRSKKKAPTPRAGLMAGLWASMRAPLRWALKWLGRGLLAAVAALLALVVLFSFVNPPTTLTIWSEAHRLGSVDHEWTPVEEIAPVMLRSVVAAEDANFCLHWGFDMRAIRQALDEGAGRGASTLSQQVVKNVFLWQDRSWLRKALEAMITPVVEVVWSKRRILEVYLNVAEFDEGVFGINAAAFRYFRTSPERLSPRQAALLAAILPDPKGRSAAKPSQFVLRKASQIVDGAETILRDGRADCFE